MKEFQGINQTAEEYLVSLKANAEFNIRALLSPQNWLYPDLNLVFNYTQRLIGPPSIQCPTGKKWCCSLNLTNVLDDGMFAFCPADINNALCPNLDPESILIDNPINSSSALIFCRAKRDKKLYDQNFIINHVRSRIGEDVILPLTEDIFEEQLKKLEE